LGARFLKRPQRNPDTVPDPDKIALLSAVRVVGVLGAEQTDPTAFTDLRVQLSGDRALAALVVFVWPIDVEEFQAGLKRQLRTLLLNRANEQGVFLYYAGIGISDMREVDWVDFTDNEERKVRLALDHESHLPMRTIATTPNEEMHDRDEDVTIYSNYKEHDGVQSPMQITREHNGQRTMQIFYTSCSNAPNLPADFFTESALQKKFKDTGGKVKAEK